MPVHGSAGLLAPTVIGGAPRDGRAARQQGAATVALLQDRRSVLRRTTAVLREHAEHLDVVVTATTWLELVHDAAFPTDLVVLDVQLREPVSIAARVRTCRAAGAQVVVLTALDDAAVRDRAAQAGAAAWLPRSLPAEALARAVEGALVGSGDQRRARWSPSVDRPARPRLSAGEELALRLYAAGASVQEVAGEMSVQYETARTFLRRVREKYARLDRPAGRRADLVARATEDGYLG